jgi:hypothetical protein
MTTLVINENSAQAKQFVKFVRTLPFVTVKKEKKAAKPEPEEEFNLYESLDRAFADVRLMMDGKKKGKTLDELIAELDELRNGNH